MGFIKQNKTKQATKTTRRGKNRTAGKAWQGRTGQDRTRQGKARQGKARQGKARQGKARQGRAEEGRAGQEQETFVNELAQDCKHKDIIKGANEEGNEERQVGQINQ